ncbi:hypothetical protein VC83_09016 [Pseudogymnoascus destructans]|uniref:Uncharacterized protein n=2 Tax=Pseudogymnoascus destructans TaxID=655981 RepID=L8FSK1_PSED2|nr:uncharacterized protein VC83_09016 [Pseudogymnoascus destructans]ELR03950.1 hypothetical protein GMDG_06478 [Pseudogymnoascus destructans 20631-21]OAF54477.1 hypothetical protein VC83_09016 [Pseudogymnoascus destructans]
MGLSEEQIRQFSSHIDNILSKSDLATISVKKVRNQLQEVVGQDLSEQKSAVNSLIEERFDKITSEPPSSPDVPISKGPRPTTNGHVKAEVKNESTPDDTDGGSAPPKKKQKKQSAADSDAKLAALLQAQENSRGRATRGGVNKKPAKAKSTVRKKKSSARVKAADDSDIELNSDGEKKVAERKGGFHKQYALSEPLAALVGETQSSRPQVVKKIWAHIKGNDLQDPSDKRQIFCDNKMKLVFKQDTVHMFTMNKLLGKHLYEVEELAAEAAAAQN